MQRRTIPLLWGAISIGAAMWVVLATHNFWGYAIGAVLIMFGWHSLKAAAYMTDSEIAEFTDPDLTKKPSLPSKDTPAPDPNSQVQHRDKSTSERNKIQSPQYQRMMHFQGLKTVGRLGRADKDEFEKLVTQWRSGEFDQFSDGDYGRPTSNKRGSGQ